MLFVILDGQVSYEWLQLYKRNHRPSSFPAAAGVHVLPRLPSIDQVHTAEEKEVNKSQSANKMHVNSSLNVAESIISLYRFAVKPWMDGLSIVYLATVAPWIGSRMQGSLELIFISTDCLTIVSLACINVLVFVVIHHLQRNRMVFSLYVKHLSHKIHIQSQKEESIGWLLKLSQPYIDFLLSWFDLETSVVTVFGQQISPSFLTALLMLLISCILSTIVIISDASNVSIAVSAIICYEKY